MTTLNLPLLEAVEESKIADAMYTSYANLFKDLFKIPYIIITSLKSDTLFVETVVGIEDRDIIKEILLFAQGLNNKSFTVLDKINVNPISFHSISANTLNIQFFTSIPLLDSKDHIDGFVYLFDSKPRNIEDKEIKLLNAVKDNLEREKKNINIILYLKNSITTIKHFNPISGLPNLNLLIERLSQALENNKNENVIIFSIKVERFNDIKRGYGRKTIQLLMQEVVSRLKSVLKQSFTLGHDNEDHFVCYLPTAFSNNTNVTASIMQIFARPYQLDKFELKLKFAIGSSVFPRDGTDAQLLVEKATIAMDGPAMNSSQLNVIRAKIMKDFNLESSLQKALHYDTLQIYYQPKIDVATGLI